MMTNGLHLADAVERAACVELAKAIEQILEHRSQERKRVRRMFRFPNGMELLKDFSYKQIRMVYGSYAELRNGKLKKLPPRGTVVAIANYLECTFEERNKLLSICQYAPLQPYITGKDLESIVSAASNNVQFNPFPAYLINRDWNLLAANEYFLRLLDMSIDDYLRIPRSARNLMNILFDDRFGVRQRLSSEQGGWENIAVQNIFAFRYTNLFCDYDDWFLARVEKWRKLSDFNRIWDQVEVYLTIERLGKDSLFPHCTPTLMTSQGQVTMQPLLTLLGHYNYPVIVSYYPSDAPSADVYRKLGIPMPESVAVYI